MKRRNKVKKISHRITYISAALIASTMQAIVGSYNCDTNIAQMTWMRGTTRLLVLEDMDSSKYATLPSTPLYVLDYSNPSSIQKISLELPSSPNDLKKPSDMCLLEDRTLLITNYDEVTTWLYSFVDSSSPAHYKKLNYVAKYGSSAGAANFRHCTKDFWSFSKDTNFNGPSSVMVYGLRNQPSPKFQMFQEPTTGKQRMLSIKFISTHVLTAQFDPTNTYRFKLFMAQQASPEIPDPSWAAYLFTPNFYIWRMEKVDDYHALIALNQLKSVTVSNFQDMIDRKYSTDFFKDENAGVLTNFYINRSDKKIVQGHKLPLSFLILDMKALIFGSRLFIALFARQDTPPIENFNVYFNVIHINDNVINLLIPNSDGALGRQHKELATSFDYDYSRQVAFYSVVSQKTYQNKVEIEEFPFEACYGQREGKHCLSCTALDDPNACTECFSGYTKVGNSCGSSSCTNNCAACDNASSCGTCDPGYYRYKSQTGDFLCHGSCGTNDYFNTEEKICENCQKKNKICVACAETDRLNYPIKIECSTCIANAEVVNKICECNSGFYFEDSSGECKSNPKHCLDYDSTANKCKTCKSIATFDEIRNECVLKCKSDEYVNSENSVCLPCVNSVNNCLKCEGFTGKCLECSEETYFKDSSQMTCAPCSEKTSFCKNCKDSGGECTECNSGYQLLIPETPIEERKCKKICDQSKNEIINKDNTACLTCPTLIQNCLLCEDYTEKCLQCSGKTFFENTDQKKCLSCSNSMEFCFECENTGGQCLNCQQGYRLNQEKTKCEKICNSNEIINNDNTKCLICPDLIQNCLSCENYSEKCLKCSSISFLEDSSQKKCRLCSDKTQFCEECEDLTGKCSRCQAGFFFNEQKDICQKKCNPQEAWVEPNNCERCLDQNCESCFNITRKCEKCGTDYEFTEKYNLLECKKKCLKENTAWILETNSCSFCKQGCQKCEDLTLNCNLCKKNFWLNSTHQCQKVCEELQPWIHPNECSQCESGCYKCQNVTLECQDKEVNSTFTQMFNKTKEYDITLYSSFLYKNETEFKLPLEGLKYKYFYKISIFNGTGNFSNLEKMTISSYTKLLENNTLETNFNLKEKYEKIYFIELTINGENHYLNKNTGESVVFQITNKTLKIENQNILEKPRKNFIEEKEENIDQLAIRASEVAITTETSGIFLSIFNPGSSSTLVKSVQILKIYNRLRYVNIDFGERLTPVLTSVGKMFKDSRDDKSSDYMYQKSRLTKGKFNRYFVHYTLFEALGWKPYGYLISFFVKNFTVSILIFFMKKYRKINTLACRLILVLRRFHLILYSSLIPDVYFFCTRTLLHMENATFFEYSLAAMLLSFSSYDFYSMVTTAEKTRDPNFEYHFESLKEEEIKINEFLKKNLKNSTRLEESREGLRFVKNVDDAPKEVIDVDKTLRSLEINNANFCVLNTEIITDIKGAYTSFAVRHNMTVFLFRIAIYQILLVSLQNLAAFCSFLLMIFELVYGIFLLLNFCALKHMKSTVVFVKKFSQTVAIFAFLVANYFMAKNQTDRRNLIIADVRIQSMCIGLLVVSLVLELIFLGLNLIFVVIQTLGGLCQKKGKKKKREFKILKGNIFYKIEGIEEEVEVGIKEEKEESEKKKKKELENKNSENEKKSKQKSKKKRKRKRKNDNRFGKSLGENEDIIINKIPVSSDRGEKIEKGFPKKGFKENKVLPRFKNSSRNRKNRNDDNVLKIGKQGVGKEKRDERMSRGKKRREREVEKRDEEEEEPKDIGFEKKQRRNFLMDPMFDEMISEEDMIFGKMTKKG